MLGTSWGKYHWLRCSQYSHPPKRCPKGFPGGCRWYRFIYRYRWYLYICSGVPLFYLWDNPRSLTLKDRWKTLDGSPLPWLPCWVVASVIRNLPDHSCINPFSLPTVLSWYLIQQVCFGTGPRKIQWLVFFQKSYPIVDFPIKNGDFP